MYEILFIAQSEINARFLGGVEMIFDETSAIFKR
jgi:hypothetical protein